MQRTFGGGQTCEVMPMGVAVAQKKSQKPPKKAPQRTEPVATRTVAVPRLLGEGEVRLYDAHKSGLPDLACPPPEKLLAEHNWVLVHFPSRRCVVVPEGRLEAFRVMKEMERGKDVLKLLPEKPKVRRVRADAGAGACAKADGKDEEAGEKEARARMCKVTPVSGDLSFEQAMKSVFPNQRITANLERLEQLQKPVFDREGNVVAWADDAMAQIAAAKLVIEHAQGRAGEKPPPPPEKKRVSYEELESMILNSPATLMHFEGLIAAARAKQAAAAAPVEAGG